MYLKRLHLVNFRNYRDVYVDFDAGVQCLVGDNGSGKTNLLDAVHYLAFTRASLSSSDAENITNGGAWFSVRGTLDVDGKNIDVSCTYQSGQKKSVFENGI